MGAEAKVKIDIQAKSNLATVLSASTKAAKGTEEALKRLNQIKLPNFGKAVADSLRLASSPSRQIATNYGKAEKHANGIYEATKAMGKLKRPAWQTTAPTSRPTGSGTDSGGIVGMSKAERERAENVEMWRAIYRQQKQKENEEAKHKKAIAKEEDKQLKARAKAEKEQGERWKTFSSSWYRVQSLMDRMAFFGSVGLNQVAFPMFGGVKNFAKESFDTMGSMRRMSMQLDMPTDDIRNFQRIVQEQGGTQEDANDALATFRENIVKAIQGDAGSLRFFGMTGTAFADKNGQARAVGSVLRDYIRNYERLLKTGGENFRRYGAQEYMQGPFGRGGEYLYSGIRNQGDFDSLMGRKGYGPTASQQAAWSSITGEATQSRIELQRRAFEFVEKNKDFIKTAIHEAAGLAKALISIVDSPIMLQALRWTAIGVGGTFFLGGLASLFSNIAFSFSALAKALSSSNFTNIARVIAGLGPRALQSGATRSFVEGAAGQAAGTAIGGSAGMAGLKSILLNPYTIGLAVIVAGAVAAKSASNKEDARMEGLGYKKSVRRVSPLLAGLATQGFGAPMPFGYSTEYIAQSFTKRYATLQPHTKWNRSDEPLRVTITVDQNGNVTNVRARDTKETKTEVDVSQFINSEAGWAPTY